MSAEPNTTLVHFIDSTGRPACRHDGKGITTWTREPGQVTCFACRRTGAFKAGQQEGVPGGTLPVSLGQVLADANHDVADLAEKAFAERDERGPRDEHWLRAQRNERGMYVIEEVIHHGDYRSRRIVEVYDVTPVTVDAIVTSSAYCYGSWLDPHGPYPEARRPKLFELVEDLRHGRVNRSIGWSTFRLITND